MKATLINAIAATAALLGVVATNGVAKADDFSCSIVDGAKNEAIQSCFTSLAPDLTDIFDAPLSLPQFNSSLGILNSATLAFTGLIQGNAGFENMSKTPSTITVDLSGSLNLKDASGTSLLELNPQLLSKYNVAGYDKTTDYGGASGKTLEGLTAEGSGSKTFTDAELTPFIGTGIVNYFLSAEATSNFSGSGNISSFVSTYAGAGVNISYNYTKKTPEPTTIIGLAVVTGLAFFCKRNQVEKKAQKMG
ncbi:PEP-CTERM sorting domain-containing protein [Phormidium sp. LEGE 05292]|uniref:choice-of-anchor E domain-containing protein n=1 Tax=[Phormidium] sp. LEGE 05292 TaxID=767427 RepID=UPI00187F6EC2|nr:PEP-CTERM sorting domain-containing protein [Phormidium sp. LEGE 05292]MBE9228250.1 PEP-CTERM sorting domain-containing protein [Phormidium sp. LEGE 05292]